MFNARLPFSLLLATFTFSTAHASGKLVTLEATPVGEYNGVAYTHYSGAFEGTTASGFYRVPFQITTPTDTENGNKSIWVEPSHFAGGLGTLNAWVQHDLVLARGFSYAGAGWSSFGNSVLDRSPGFAVWIADTRRLRNAISSSTWRAMFRGLLSRLKGCR